MRAQFFRMLSARLVANLLQAVNVLVLARAVTPADIGLTSAIIGLCMVVYAITDVGMSTLVATSYAREDHATVATALRIITFTTWFFGLVGLFAAIALFAIDVIPLSLAVLPLAVAVDRCVEYRLSVPIAADSKSIPSSSILIRRSIQLVVFIGLVLIDVPELWAYSVAQLIGSLVGYVQSTVFLRRLVVPVKIRRPPREVVRAGIAFCVNDVTAHFQMLDSFIVSSVAGTYNAGLYAAAMRVTSPLALIPGTLAAAVLPPAARTTPAQSRRIGVKLGGLALIVVLVGAPLGFLGAEPLCVLLYGETYRGAGLPLAVLLVGIPFAILAAALSAILQAQGRERYVAHVGIGYALAFVAAVGVGGSMHGALGAAIGGSLVSAIRCAPLLGGVLRLGGSPRKRLRGSNRYERQGARPLHGLGSPTALRHRDGDKYRDGGDLSMGLVQFIGLVAVRWRILVAGLMLGLLGAAGVSMNIHPQYQSSARVFVGTCNEGSIEQAYQCGMFTKDRALSYASLVSSDQLAERVKNEVGLEESIGEVAANIEATTIPDTTLIQIDATATDPTTARTMADSAADQFTELISEIELPGGGEAAGAFNVTVVQAAKEATVVSGASPVVSLLLGAIAGLVAGFIAAIVRDRMDPTLRTPGQVVATGLPVLGTAPAANWEALDLWSAADDRADAFRRLLPVIRPYVARPGHVLAIVEPRLRGGATAITIGLARVASEAGARVLVVDADMRADADSIVGHEATAGLAELLCGPHRRMQPSPHRRMLPSLVTWDSPNIRLLGPGTVPPGHAPGSLMASSRLTELMTNFRAEFDIVLVRTTPALEAADAALIARAVDSTFLVVEIGNSTGPDVRESVEILHAAGAGLRGALTTPRTRAVRRRRRSLSKAATGAPREVTEESSGGETAVHAVAGPNGAVEALPIAIDNITRKEPVR